MAKHSPLLQAARTCGSRGCRGCAGCHRIRIRPASCWRRRSLRPGPTTAGRGCCAGRGCAPRMWKAGTRAGRRGRGESVGQGTTRGVVAGCPPGGWGASFLRSAARRARGGLVRFRFMVVSSKGADDVGQVDGSVQPTSVGSLSATSFSWWVAEALTRHSRLQPDFSSCLQTLNSA